MRNIGWRAVLYLTHKTLARMMMMMMVICASCAYRQGAPERTLPGGFMEVRVPMFKNITQEVGIETYFTNALIDEINHSHVAKLNPSSDLELLGTIHSVQYVSSGPAIARKFGKDNLAVNREYRVVIVFELTLKKRFEEVPLWSDKFTGERSFASSFVKSTIVSGANPLYNLSARRRNISELAMDMVAEATDKLTESF